MPFGARRACIVVLLLIVATVAALVIGSATGFFIARTRNIQRTLDVGKYTPALPSLILDRRGKLITRFFSEEKREILSLDEMSPHLVHAALAKEDRIFYDHIGFSVKGILRAAWNIATGNYFSGGSTISQQVAGSLYQDREVKTIRRKLKELFWSLQLEKSRSKEEILEVYLNNSSFGHGTYGVEAACQFYFGHSAREVTPAEAAMLMSQLARINSMIHNPNRAKIIQRATLDSMVELSFITAEHAEESFDEFWRSYDSTRSNLSTTHTERYDQAPYFSELIRRLFEDEFYGPSDLYRDGYVIYTTLDLEYQRTAVALVEETRKRLEARYRGDKAEAFNLVETAVLPAIELLSYMFSAPGLLMEAHRKKTDATEQFDRYLEKPLGMISLVLGSEEIGHTASLSRWFGTTERPDEGVEGALVTVDNGTGHILAMVGGSDFTTLKLNRATDSLVSPGSAVKPLYYASAIDTGVITPATMIYDSPAVFLSASNPPYVPRNFTDTFSGPISVRYALARSINIPSLKVLEAMGLEPGIESIAAFLGKKEQASDKAVFPRAYSVGLGSIGVSPLELTSSYAVFPRQGRALEPLAIRYIEDRYGEVIYDNGGNALQRSANRRRVVTPQAAYLMTDMLTTTLTDGTLARHVAEAGGLGGIPMAAKTGTNENWSDAWTVGFSPYMTTAVWFGTVMPGDSLGRYQTGALAAGPVWVRYMKEIHKDLPYRDFGQPVSGLISRRVCAVSGMLPTEACPKIIDELFITGTEPEELCTYHPRKEKTDAAQLRRLTERFTLSDQSRPEILIGPPIHAEPDEIPESPVDEVSPAAEKNPFM